MQQLINDLIVFSKIPTTELKFENTEMVSIIEEVTAELKDIIEEKHARIEIGPNCSANIIIFQFQQLLFNLISNSLKFSQPDIPPHIIITSSIIYGSEINDVKFLPEKKYCHLAITDNGIGFESHFSERIFEMLQKLHSKEMYAGTGIGLAIVKKVIENHHGIIVATSQLKKGTTFDVYFPNDAI